MYESINQVWQFGVQTPSIFSDPGFWQWDFKYLDDGIFPLGGMFKRTLKNVMSYSWIKPWVESRSAN